jgi:hypothetical protein
MRTRRNFQMGGRKLAAHRLLLTNTPEKFGNYINEKRSEPATFDQKKGILMGLRLNGAKKVVW